MVIYQGSTMVGVTLPEGFVLPSLTNPAGAADISKEKTAYNDQGQLIMGTRFNPIIIDEVRGIAYQITLANPDLPNISGNSYLSINLKSIATIQPQTIGLYYIKVSFGSGMAGFGWYDGTNFPCIIGNKSVTQSLDDGIVYPVTF